MELWCIFSKSHNVRKFVVQEKNHLNLKMPFCVCLFIYAIYELVWPVVGSQKLDFEWTHALLDWVFELQTKS